MVSNRNFYNELAVGAPAPKKELENNLERVIHFSPLI